MLKTSNLTLPAAILGSILVGLLIQALIQPYPQTIIASICVNIILAVSLNLVNGFTGQFSMGHAGFMAVGAYVSASLTTLLLPAALTADPYLGHLALFAGIILGALAAGLAGLVVGIPSLRLKGDYLAIVTLGFGEIIRIFILNIDAIGGARGMIAIPQLSTMPWLVTTAALVVIALYRLINSIPGKQFMAVRDDETATLAMGLSTTRIKVKAFVFSSALAGVAGALFAHYQAYLNPSTFTFNLSFQVIAMVVLGGMGSLSGSISAAVLLTVLLEALRELQDITEVDLRMVFYSIILIVIMLTRPSGIFGSKEIFDWFRIQKKSEGATS